MLSKIKVLEKVVAKKSYHESIQNIFIDDRYMVATDEFILLAVPHFRKVEQPMLVVNPKVKYPLAVEGTWEGIAVNYRIAKEYPDYQRVLNGAGEYKQVTGNWGLLDFLYHLSHHKGWVIDYINRGTVIKHLDGKLGEVKAYCYKGNKKELFLKFDGGITLVLVPIVTYADVNFDDEVKGIPFYFEY